MNAALRSNHASLAVVVLTSVASICSIAIVGCGGGSNSPKDGGTGSPPPVAWKAAVGGAGAFVQTFDDVAWNERALTDTTQFGVACVGNLDGWAVGAHGTIAHTVDGGGTWSWQSAGVAADLRGVRFADAMHGLAVGALDAVSLDEADGPAIATGAHGRILTRDPHTQTWTSEIAPADVDLHAALISGTRLYVAGDDGALFTRDVGDATWSTVHLASAAPLYGLDDL
jgi:photosystem II stability/assembly factor-like uncharacterized protein